MLPTMPPMSVTGANYLAAGFERARRHADRVTLAVEEDGGAAVLGFRSSLRTKSPPTSPGSMESKATMPLLPLHDRDLPCSAFP